MIKLLVMHRLVTSALLDPNILLSTLLSNTLGDMTLLYSEYEAQIR